VKTYILLSTLILLTGCVSGPPAITPAQIDKYYDTLELYKSGDVLPHEFENIAEVDGLSCTAKYGARITGEEKGALHIMKVKAASLNADAVINYSCGTGMFLNNCWFPTICSGVAVRWKM
jgi:uncharacterized protein YbjQ (UPF0145 family)